MAGSPAAYYVLRLRLQTPRIRNNSFPITAAFLHFQLQELRVPLYVLTSLLKVIIHTLHRCTPVTSLPEAGHAVFDCVSDGRLKCASGPIPKHLPHRFTNERDTRLRHAALFPRDRIVQRYGDE